MGVSDIAAMPHRVVFLLALGAAMTFAQTCSQDGSSYSYTEAVSSNTRTIVTNHCPNHPYYNSNPNYAVSTSTTITVPTHPQLKGAAVTQSPSTGGGTAGASLTAKGGSVGVFFSGAMLFSPYGGPTYGTVSGFSTSATYAEGNTFDQCGCHSSSTATASYHCHVPPNCLMYQLGSGSISTSAHSPQIGWAADGFPMYGPHGPSGTMMKTCTQTSGTYGTNICTDDCGGYYKDDNSIDNFKYRYYVQGTYAAGTSCTSPACPSPKAEYYPNTPVCYRGCCPSGVTCSYGSTVVPACSGSYANGYTVSYTASTTSSNGAAGAGTNMASGLPVLGEAHSSAGCACASLACESTTCSSANQGWQYTTCSAQNNNCPGSTPVTVSNGSIEAAVISVVAMVLSVVTVTLVM